MKYQLLLLTIYLITVYSQKACNTYTTDETCDEADNCEWEVTKAGSCGQKTTKDCSGLSGDNCKDGCTLKTTGTCANSKTADECTEAANCGETAGCTAGKDEEEEDICTPTTGNICKGETQDDCEKETTNSCAWTPGASTCSNSCTELTKANCGTNTDCTWTEATGTCKTIEGPKGGSGSGSGSGSGTGTGTGTGTGDSDSSNYVKFGNYLLVLFLFLF